jgi:ABC-type transporter MlaC component
MAETVVFGLDVVQFVTTVSAFVTTAMVSYIALKVRQAANEVLRTIEANRRRSQRHKRVIFGDEGIPGLVDRVSYVEEETDA